MSEVEKLYKNAKIDNYRLENFCGLVPKGYTTIDDKERKGYVKVVRYFSPEKQLELLHLIITRIADIDRIYIECDNSTGKICFYSIGNEGDDCDTLEDALASYINDIWQDLTEQERTEIRSILRG